MLVLTRNPSGTIIIGETTKITIVEVRGYKVRIGIEAPKDVRIHRGEVLAAIEAAKSLPQFDCLSCFGRFGSAEAAPHCPTCHYHTSRKVVD